MSLTGMGSRLSCAEFLRTPATYVSPAEERVFPAPGYPDRRLTAFSGFLGFLGFPVFPVLSCRLPYLT